MGQTNQKYPVFEAALSLEDAAAHTSGTKERKQVGDIIGIRKPLGYVGSGEMHRYLWLWLEGLEENEMARLTDPLSADPLNEDSQHFDKRRYAIPLERLKSVVPSFNIARALDVADMYQPFLMPDLESPFRHLTSPRPLNANGLVFDKLIMRFI